MTTPPPPVPGSRVRHSYRCARRSPLVTAQRILDDGRVVTYHKCSGCAGSDLDTALLARLIKTDPPSAA